jgi:hypothetical protein
MTHYRIQYEFRDKHGSRGGGSRLVNKKPSQMIGEIYEDAGDLDGLPAIIIKIQPIKKHRSTRRSTLI